MLDPVNTAEIQARVQATTGMSGRQYLDPKYMRPLTSTRDDSLLKEYIQEVTKEPPDGTRLEGVQWKSLEGIKSHVLREIEKHTSPFTHDGDTNHAGPYQ